MGLGITESGIKSELSRRRRGRRKEGGDEEKGVNEGRSKNLHVLLFFAGKSGMEVGMGWPLYKRDRQGLCNSLGCLRTQKSASQVLGDM